MQSLGLPDKSDDDNLVPEWCSSPGSIRTTQGLSEHTHQALPRGPSPISLLRPDPLYTKLSTSIPPKQSPHLSVPVLGPLRTQQSQKTSSPFRDTVQRATAELQRLSRNRSQAVWVSWVHVFSPRSHTHRGVTPAPRQAAGGCGAHSADRELPGALWGFLPLGNGCPLGNYELPGHTQG